MNRTKRNRPAPFHSPSSVDSRPDIYINRFNVDPTRLSANAQNTRPPLPLSRGVKIFQGDSSRILPQHGAVRNNPRIVKHLRYHLDFSSVQVPTHPPTHPSSSRLRTRLSTPIAYSMAQHSRVSKEKRKDEKEEKKKMRKRTIC